MSSISKTKESNGRPDLVEVGGFLNILTTVGQPDICAMSFTKTPLHGKHADILDSAFGVKNSFWSFEPGRFLMPPYFEDIAQKVLDSPVRDDDVWLVSYPRTGSTWTQEIIWLIGNDLNFDKAKRTIQQLRAPMIELSTYFAEYTDFITNYGNSVEIVNNWPSPRFIKTHLPSTFLPHELFKMKPKIIYVARNPKDLCVSYYHHCKLLHHMELPFEEFADLFLHDTVPLGSVFTHLLPFWKKRHEPNILFLKYEDLKRDTAGGIRKIATFMEKPLTDQQVQQLCDFLTIDNMKKYPGCNMAPIVDSLMGENYYNNCGKNFIRKGQVGDWKNYMSEELSAKFDLWISRNLQGTDLSFD